MSSTDGAEAITKDDVGAKGFSSISEKERRGEVSKKKNQCFLFIDSSPRLKCLCVCVGQLQKVGPTSTTREREREWVHTKQ